MCSQKVLLINASNMESFPVYPYAFIQVSAVARRVGIEVICKDLLGIPLEAWEQTVHNLIKRHHPTMILIILRNTDSLGSKDYDRLEGESAYFPIERTKELIAAIRVVSNLKIVVGGFGFSVMPDEIMHYLRPDLGVFGGADAFFENFEDVQAGNYKDVANLLYFKEDQLISNPRHFFPPLAGIEYTPQAIEEMMEFYASFPSPGFEGAPVEIMRGCTHSCVFCSEPHVKGRRVRYRDLSTIMGDIKMLVAHGITKIYLVSSELNPEGNAFVLQLADKILSFNERQTEDRRITWYGANYLLNFTFHEYERLYDSGFTGGWFDITALDDENARAMRTPYRNESLVAHLKTFAQFERKRLGNLQGQEAPQSDGKTIEENTNRGDTAVKWTIFLGNPSTTSKTIRNTLQVANLEGFAQLFEDCSISKNLRVFDYEKPNKDTLIATYSVTPNLERIAYTQTLPSFAYPPGLLQDFGTEEEIELMFDHIAETYLSTKYQKSRDWSNFVHQNTTADFIANWMAELLDIEWVELPINIRPVSKGEPSTVLQEVFAGEPKDDEGHNSENLAKQVVDSLLSECLQVFPDLFGSMEMPTTMDELERVTPYELTVAIFSRWHTEEEFINELTKQSELVMSKSMHDFVYFCFQAILYKFNVRIKPEYRDLFISC